MGSLFEALGLVKGRAKQIDSAVENAQKGAKKPASNPQADKLRAELKRLQASTDPISAAPRKRRIAKIQQMLSEMK